MGSICYGSPNKPLLLLDPPVVGDLEYVSENEDFRRFYNAALTSGVRFQSTPNMINSTLKRSPALPRRKSAEVPNGDRRRCPEKSLKQMIQERNTIVNPGCFRDDYEAMQYCDALEEDTWMELKDTCQIAETLVQKGADIGEELTRENRVIHKANRDMHSTVQELKETSYKLKGMKSLGAKLGNFIWKPKAHSSSDFMCESRDFRTTTISLSAYSPYSSPKRTSQQQIKAGIGQLSLTLDKVRSQQLAIADELQYQEEQFQEFDRNMERISGEIHQQNDLIYSIKSS